MKKIILIITILILGISDLIRGGGFVYAQDDASDIQNKIENLGDKKEAIEGQLNVSQARLQKTQAQMNVTKNLLAETETELSRKEAEVKNIEDRITLNRNILKAYIQEMYWSSDQDMLVSLVMTEKKTDELSGEFDQLSGVKDKITRTIADINRDKEEAEKARSELSEKQEDHEQLLSVQQGQQYEIKSDIQEAQATLSEINAKIEKLRGELASLLGGSVSAKDIKDAASFAAKVTGIRKDYLLGVLVVESNLGRYTGGCTFKQSRMSSYRATIFKSICKDLKYDYNKMKVSCPPSGYRGTGGAMGVAQFMPDTWRAYEKSIASTTTHDPPDPWSLLDGVTAMALKLTKVSGVTDHKKSAEAKAYCVYLAGNNWAAYCDSKGVDYGAKVLYWADNYERLLD
jgi:peptidoglycan hydrolase CwlO-like protein